MRMLDLASSGSQAIPALFLVAPDDREADVRKQLSRPAFRNLDRLDIRYLPYGELERHRDAMARLGEGIKAVQAVARALLAP